jgi:hypothetical protein
VPPTLQAVAARSDAKPVSSRTGPLALWHLLSLDAPSVAAVWMWFIAKVSHVTLAPEVCAAMFVAVWLIYAADRLLDTSAGQAQLEARHHFHHRHRGPFTQGIAVGSVILAALVVKMPVLLFLLYCGLAGLLFVWFAVIHLLPKNHAERLPKELAVGVFFSAAVFMPEWLAVDGARGWMAMAAICFGLLCTLNCLSIYAWEHEGDTLATANPTTQFGVRSLRPLCCFTIAAPLVAATLAPARLTPVFVAVPLAAALLLALDHLRRELDRTSLRVAADLVLLTPLLAAAFLR